MGEVWGVLAAVLSSGLGGTSVGATRFLVGVLDPLAIGALRFGVGFLLLLPVAWLRDEPWPPRRDWPGVAGLGLLFFAAFPILFNAALIFTTAARGALALSTLPLLTMVAGACLGTERLTPRKTVGVSVAMLGVVLALAAGSASAPSGAWRGDLLMVGAASCMAMYSVRSRLYIHRSGPLAFTTMGMGVGAACLLLMSWGGGSLTALASFGSLQWAAILYLGAFGAAVTFYLWSVALGRTSPTRVAITVTVNPVTASLVGAALLGEPLRWRLLLGIATVFAGIWIATAHGAQGKGKKTTPVLDVCAAPDRSWSGSLPKG